VLESEYGGFCSTFSRSQDRFNLAELTANLGERFETMGIALKFYSCVGSNHTTLDAIRAMQARHPFGADDVERFVVHGSQVTVDHVGWKYKPEGLTSAQLNLPFCVATYMLEGDCFVEQFTEDCVADPDRMAYSERVETQHDPAITAKGSAFRHLVRVEVFLKDGTHMEETCESARGSEKQFASEADVVEKFRKLARHALPEDQMTELQEAILDLDNLADATEIPRLLAR
ncbi:MAG: MmgE/PrpD family protein, partial [Pseudomonadota bacterium]